MKKIEDILERATASYDVQVVLANPANPRSWVWPEKPVAQWPLDIANIEALVQARTAAETEWQFAAGEWDKTANLLADHSRDIARLARTKFRNDPVNLRLWQSIRVRRNSRPGIYRTGAALREAWAKSDAAWVPKTGLALADYDGLLATCHACGKLHQGRETALNKATGNLQTAAARLDDDCVAWYSDATTHFPADTADGIMLRTTVPTTTVPAPLLGPAVIVNLLADGNTIHFDCTAPHATKFTYLHLAPGAPDYEVVAENTPEKSVTLENQAPGLHWFKAVSANAGSTGAASAPVSVEVAAEHSSSAQRTATPVDFMGGAAKSA